MYALLIYSLKVGACLAVFYLFFKLLLSRETFHRLNRLLVLGAMTLSFMLPLCVITIRREISFLPQLPDAVVPAPAAKPAVAPFDWELLAGAVFVAGAAAMLLWVLRSLAGVVRLIRSGRRERLEDGAVLVRTPHEVTPFSWGRYIVLSEQDAAGDAGPILVHERAHGRLHHSWDLLLSDLAGCLQWFNPAMWLLRRELRAIHEYEADEAVLKSGADARQYQLLLIKKAAGKRWYSVADSFNHSKLKNRITMMLRKRSSRWAAARALLLLPLTGLALASFARTAYVFPEDKVKKETVTVRVSGAFSADSMPKPLFIVDGKEAASIEDIDPGRIASVSVLKDSLSIAPYGGKGRNGVIVVTLREPGEVPESAAGAVSVRQDISCQRNSDSTATIVVTGYAGANSQTLLVDTLSGRLLDIRSETVGNDPDKPTIRTSVSVVSRSDASSGSVSRSQVYEVRSAPGLLPETAEAVTSAAGEAEPAAEAVAKIDAAREALKAARDYMGPAAYRQAANALDEAEQHFRVTVLKDTVDPAAEITTGEGIARVTHRSDEGVSVYRGKITLKDYPANALMVVDGEIRSAAYVERLAPKSIKYMKVWKGDSAFRKFGEQGRHGVIEIRTRK